MSRGRVSGRGSGKRLSAAGEELLAMADRAGLDRQSRNELREMMVEWSQRFVLREAGRNPRPSSEAALVALTVSYLRRILRAS